MEISFLLSGQQISLPLNIFLFSILALNFLYHFILQKNFIKILYSFHYNYYKFCYLFTFLIFENMVVPMEFLFFETFGNEIYPFQIRDNLIINYLLFLRFKNTLFNCNSFNKYSKRYIFFC